MKIALVGYGKMGQMIAQAAKRAGHEIVMPSSRVLRPDSPTMTGEK